MSVPLTLDDEPSLPPLAETYWCESCQQEYVGVCGHHSTDEQLAAAVMSESPLDVTLLFTRG